MKKIILFTVWLILLFDYSFIITAPRNNIFAATTTVSCNELCTHSFGETIDPKEYPKGGVQCDEKCPKCQPGTYSSSGIDSSNICTATDYKPESSDYGGSEFGKSLHPPIPPNAAICGDSNTGCHSCVEQGDSWTALGCLSTSNPQVFVGQILTIALLISGGVAFLLVVFGGLQIILSGGVPERVKAGKEMIVAAIAGLLLIIFSVFILRLVGYDILRLPGFGK